MAKMKLTVDSQGYVTLAYDCDVTDRRVVREFTCRDGGGYVWEITGNDRRQVCNNLWDRGETLTAPSRQALADVIRREYRAMRDAERRADRAW